MLGERSAQLGLFEADKKIDWDDTQQKDELLQSIVADADRLLELAREKLSMCSQASAEGQRLREAAGLLSQVMLQDIEREAEGAAITEGVSADRVISVQDPEMHYGHKSKAQRFDGHKAAMAVDTESQLITAVTVLPGNAADSDHALELVCQSEKNAQVEVEESVGDCAYGDRATRQAFADAGRVLRAAAPKRRNRGFFDKEDFSIDVQAKTCRCPAGQTCHVLKNKGTLRDRHGKCYPRQAFESDATVCSACHLRSSCIAAGPEKGRTVSLHPQEALLQEARRLQHSAA